MALAFSYVFNDILRAAQFFFFSCRGTCVYGVERNLTLHELTLSAVMGGFEFVNVGEPDVRESLFKEPVHSSHVGSVLFLTSLIWKLLL